MNPLLILGVLGVVFTAAQLLPQVVKVLRTHSVRDLSGGTLIIIAAGAITWTVYALLIQDIPILIANLLNLSFTLFLLGKKIAER